MAMTPFRWVAVLIIAFMALVVLVLPDLPERTEADGDPQGLRLSLVESAARRQASQTARRWAMARVTDSLRRPFSQLAHQPIRVMYSASIAPERRHLIDSMIARGVARLGDSLLVGVDIAVVADDSGAFNFTSRNTSGAGALYSLPTAPGQRCLGVVTVARNEEEWTQRTRRTEMAAERTFGPCAYYAVFGMPGPAIASWMKSRGSLLAQEGSWTHAAIRTVSSGRPQVKFFEGSHPALDYLSFRGTECAAGNVEVCEQIALKPNPVSGYLSVGHIVTPNGILGSHWFRSDFAGQEAELMAGMVRSLGREKFGAFWTSSDSVPVAFERASGLRLGAWIASHLTERMGEIRRGPTTSAMSVFNAALIVGLAIFLVLRVAMRREYR